MSLFLFLILELFSPSEAFANNYNICKIKDSVQPGKIRIEYTAHLEGTIGGFVGRVVGQDIHIDQLELYYNHPTLNCHPINELTCHDVEPLRNTRMCYDGPEGCGRLGFFMMLDGLTDEEIQAVHLQLGITAPDAI